MILSETLAQIDLHSKNSLFKINLHEELTLIHTFFNCKEIPSAGRIVKLSQLSLKPEI